MFENATRLKYRFDTVKGQISVEDLWDLPLTARTNFDLDTVAKNLAKEIRESSEESFVKVTTTKSAVLEDKLKIVKHIISVKLAEADARETAKAKESQREIIKGIIAEKQLGELRDKSIEELAKLLD